MKNKLISVIVPVYNVEQYLSKCIDSIINQTYTNIEIILVDDGSTDKSGQICENFKLMDDRILVIHKNNEGLSSARNTGLDIANGDLISFVDSDDYVENNFLENLKNNMDKYDSDISICNYYKVNEFRRKNNIFSEIEFCVEGKNKYYNLYNQYGLLTVLAWNKLYKKTLFNNIRYPDGKIYEDLYIIGDILEKSRKVSYILEPLYNYVSRQNSIINTFTLKHFDIVSAHDKKIETYKKKKYYDLEIEENNKKIISIIELLAKMDAYCVDNINYKIEYYNEIKQMSNELSWHDSCFKVKLFKKFQKKIIVFYKLKFVFKYKIKNYFIKYITGK